MTIASQRVAGAYNRHMHARLEHALEDADHAFWDAVKQAFPEVTTDDLPMALDARFRAASFAAVAGWLEANYAEPVHDEHHDKTQGGDDGG